MCLVVGLYTLTSPPVLLWSVTGDGHINSAIGSTGDIDSDSDSSSANMSGKDDIDSDEEETYEETELRLPLEPHIFVQVVHSEVFSYLTQVRLSQVLVRV